MTTAADTTSGGNLIFGVDHFCPRCGEMARRRIFFSASLNVTQADAWGIEYCEHCMPVDLLCTFSEMFNTRSFSDTTGSPR